MRSGDMKAFERLFVSLYPGLCNIANHYLNNEMLSKDVAQDAFIKWWNKREDFRDFAAVKSFLYITIRNQCLNYIRDHRKEVDLAGSSGDILLESYAIATPLPCIPFFKM